MTCTKPIRKQDWSTREQPCGCVECEIDRRLEEMAREFREHVQVTMPRWGIPVQPPAEFRRRILAWFGRP